MVDFQRSSPFCVCFHFRAFVGGIFCMVNWSQNYLVRIDLARETFCITFFFKLVRIHMLTGLVFLGTHYRFIGHLHIEKAETRMVSTIHDLVRKRMIYWYYRPDHVVSLLTHNLATTYVARI